jgi:hypothetical protein
MTTHDHVELEIQALITTPRTLLHYIHFTVYYYHATSPLNDVRGAFVRGSAQNSSFLVLHIDINLQDKNESIIVQRRTDLFEGLVALSDM